MITVERGKKQLQNVIVLCLKNGSACWREQKLLGKKKARESFLFSISAVHVAVNCAALRGTSEGFGIPHIFTLGSTIEIGVFKYCLTTCVERCLSQKMRRKCRQSC